MISREEALWLYKCILGRPPESDAALDWAVCHDDSFNAARDRFLAADEFYFQRGRVFIARQHSLASKRQDRILSAMNLLHAEPAAEPSALIEPGRHDLLLKCLYKRFSAQVIVVIGSNAALEEALRIVKFIGVNPVLIVKCGGDGRDDDVGKWLSAKPGLLVEGTTIVERRVEIDRLLDQLERESLDIDLFVTDSPIPDQVIRRCFLRLPTIGLMLFHTAENRAETLGRVARAADYFHVDVVEIGDFALLQRTSWFSPVRYVPSVAAEISAGRAERLAIACIVKDEESNIEVMLRSCLPIADFVAIVDTGSSDDTIKLAREVLLEAKIDHIILEAEFDNFGSARNIALDAVPSDCTWTLMLDADEHLVPEDYRKWLDLLSASVEAWSIPRYNFNDAAKIDDPTPYPDRQRRLIRNRLEKPIRFQGRVHETLLNIHNWGIAPANMMYFGGSDGGPHIHHMGQVNLTQERWERKNAFYSKLLTERN